MSKSAGYSKCIKTFQAILFLLLLDTIVVTFVQVVVSVMTVTVLLKQSSLLEQILTHSQFFKTTKSNKP